VQLSCDFVHAFVVTQVVHVVGIPWVTQCLPTPNPRKTHTQRSWVWVLSAVGMGTVGMEIVWVSNVGVDRGAILNACSAMNMPSLISHSPHSHPFLLTFTLAPSPSPFPPHLHPCPLNLNLNLALSPLPSLNSDWIKVNLNQ
jgi:hypothetical protein